MRHPGHADRCRAEAEPVQIRVRHQLGPFAVWTEQAVQGLVGQTMPVVVPPATDDGGPYPVGRGRVVRARLESQREVELTVELSGEAAGLIAELTAGELEHVSIGRAGR